MEGCGPLELDGGQRDVGRGRHHGAAARLQGDGHELLVVAGGTDVDSLLPCLRVDRCLKLFVLLFQSLHELSRLLLVEDYWTLHRGRGVCGIHPAVKF